MGSKMERVCVFLGEGFEEIEALAVVDLLRRADIDTRMVSVTADRTVTGSHGIPVIVDWELSEVDFEQVKMLVLPGGLRGTEALESCGELMEQVDAFMEAGKMVCAICAAPSILGRRGLLKGKKATVYPGFESHLRGAEVVEAPAVTDGNLITARGMGCAIDFGLAIVEHLKGEKAKEALAEQIVYQQ